MATQVQFRRGTTAEHAGFTGEEGELTIDTDKETAVIHDGSTAGGFPLLRNVVEDLAPMLGGHLDLNGFNVVASPAATVTSNGNNVDIVASDGGTTSGDGGTVTLRAGAVTAGAGGDVVLEPKDGTTDFGAVVVQQTTNPPSTTADKMYNNSGDLYWNGDKLVGEAPAVPTFATDPGVAGQVAWDASFWYVCVAPNTWVRAALLTW